MQTLATAPRRNTTTRVAKLCALAAGLSLLSLNAFAGGDSALYPTAPKGSAFVRVYNASSQEITPSIGTAKFTAISPTKSSAYAFVPGGSYTAQLGGSSLPITLTSDHYYTVVNETSGAKLVEESKFENKQKARLDVQNLTDQSLTLKTADGKTEVVPNVAPSKGGAREINPVKVSLALYSGDKKVADVKPVTLERGQITSLYVTGSGSNLKPEWVIPPAS
ncbi:alginate O-acetyltransferase AlgF [Pseudomonas typographi]|uniref:Alginate biosynthesis protein AlgF n=1 Tax=Pseudomonas typographi TaxID=2715964 RepID=A0ABR7YYT4_9PSED|nr:alginate O-acetyltransferase AlgF [Pseudomonas typographi]MBD1550816.1 alginate O-acetyltransferase [Pseudomonas typographi]MBD1587758.1 alginate O-acetyltransferase [Pseudomonas typographi]MBD1598281.1 alginate O-acetyltransferase [Pseudomonas typographi]